MIFQTKQSKVPILAEILADGNHLACGLTETHLTEGHLAAEVKIPGYQEYRGDRKKRAKASGGVILYLRDDIAITSEPVFEYSCGVIECIAVHVGTLNLTIILAYRPPDNVGTTDKPAKYRSRATEYRRFHTKLSEFLDSRPNPSPDVLLMGDFNLPHADWLSGECKAGTTTRPTKEEKDIVQMLFDLATNHFLVQQVEGPTHRQGNLLDLVFTNNSQLVHSSEATPTVLSDHLMIQFTANYARADVGTDNEENTDEAEDAEPQLRDYNFHSDAINWDSISEAIDEVNWETEFSELDPEGMMSTFLEKLSVIAADLVPLRKKKEQPKSTIPRHRRTLMRNRRNLNRAYNLATNPERKQAIERKLIGIEKNLQASFEAQERRDEERAVGNIKTNSKYFYAYANKKSKLKTTIGPLINAAKKLVSSAKDMAEMLSQQYMSVFSQPKYPPSSPHDLFPDEEVQELSCGPPGGGKSVRQPYAGATPAQPPGAESAQTGAGAPLTYPVSDAAQPDTTSAQPTGADVAQTPPGVDAAQAPLDRLLNFEVLREDLVDAMSELSPTSAAGPDGVPAILLKNCRLVISRPLALLWGKSLQDGKIPAICKTANIVPIHKGKSRAVPANYRPVALTSQLIKIFEKVVRRKIVSHLDRHNSFNTSQHGFRAGRSCVSQLLSHFDHVTALLEQGKSVDVIYLDFAKAFDKVDIGVTLRKLHSLGIRGNVGRWLTAFLTNREQAVVINNSRSQAQPMISGVPQGSVLGPLLFLILIGDIDQEVANSFLSSFADDTRVGRGIESEGDARLLQADLEAVYRWADTNNMMFNSDKFEVLRYKAKNQNVDFSYTSNGGESIAEKNSLTDLGVTMSCDATFREHIQAICSKVKKKAGWALRTFKSRDRLLMMTVWKSLCIPHHDYCSQLWCPNQTGLIQNLELLQRAFIRKIRGLRHLSYWEQLKNLKLYSLERRRERYIIIYVWQILENLVPNLDVTKIVASGTDDRRGRLCTTPAVSRRAPAAVQATRTASLPVRGTLLFNCLPSQLRNMTGCHREAFKAALDRYLSSIPDEPLIPGYTAFRRCASNSLVDWVSALRVQQDLAGPGAVAEERRDVGVVHQHDP